jgi:hypothetical protein
MTEQNDLVVEEEEEKRYLLIKSECREGGREGGWNVASNQIKSTKRREDRF